MSRASRAPHRTPVRSLAERGGEPASASLRRVDPASAEGRRIVELLELELERKRQREGVEARPRPEQRPAPSAAWIAAIERIKEERRKVKYYISPFQHEIYEVTRELAAQTGQPVTPAQVGERLGREPMYVARAAVGCCALVYQDGHLVALEGEVKVDHNVRRRALANAKEATAHGLLQRPQKPRPSARIPARAQAHLDSGDWLAAAAHLIWHELTRGKA